MNWDQVLFVLTPALLMQMVEHGLLLMAVMLPAAATGVALAVAMRRYRVARETLGSIGSGCAALPGIALLAISASLFGLPEGGWGIVVTLVTLFGYGAVMIAIYSHQALDDLDPTLLEVSLALGLDRQQRLWELDVPLASPAILAGITQVTATIIGLIAIGAYLGLGGLGQPIYHGLRTGEILPVLLGGGLLLLVSMITVALLGWLQQRLTIQGPDR